MGSKSKSSLPHERSLDSPRIGADSGVVCVGLDEKFSSNVSLCGGADGTKSDFDDRLPVNLVTASKSVEKSETTHCSSRNIEEMHTNSVPIDGNSDDLSRAALLSDGKAVHEEVAGNAVSNSWGTVDHTAVDSTLASTTLQLPLCPPGLESLLDAGQLVAHMGNLRHDYIFNVRCEKRMEVINELRRVLFYAEEEPPQTESGSFLFKLYDKNKEEVANVYCPASRTCHLCGLSWLWFRSCHFQAVVYCPPGVIAGFVRQAKSCLVQEFQILNTREEVILRLRGAPTDLEIYSVDLQHGIGRLSVHGWVGVMHEIRRTANDYGLTFPIDLDVRVKGLLLAAVFAIDWLYRTSGGRR